MKYKMMLVFGPFSPASTANSEIIQHRQIVHDLPSAPTATQFARPFLISRYDNALNSHECDSLCLFAVPMALIHKLREYYFIDFAFFPFDLGAMTFMLICFVGCVHSRHMLVFFDEGTHQRNTANESNLMDPFGATRLGNRRF